MCAALLSPPVRPVLIVGTGMTTIDVSGRRHNRRTTTAFSCMDKPNSHHSRAQDGRPVTTSTPLWSELASTLRTELAEMPPGSPLSSEHSLAKHYRVSRNTVREALKALGVEGLIMSRQGRPWIKKDTLPAVMDLSAVERTTTPEDTWAIGIRSQGREPTQRLRVETINGPRWATDLLRLPAAEVLVVRRRWRFVDGILANTADTYYQESLVRGSAITRPEGLIPGAYQVMEELGRPWVEQPEDRIVVRALVEPERDAFGASPGLPAAELTRIRWSVDGAPTAVTRMLLPGDRNELVYNPRHEEEA